MRFSILFLLLFTSCVYQDPATVLKAREAYEELCPEAKLVSFEELNQNSKCKGISIIVVGIQEVDRFEFESKLEAISELFRDERGFTDDQALQSFIEPVTGRTIPHLIAEFGNAEDIDGLNEVWTRSLLKIDKMGENIFHKFVRNKLNYIPTLKYLSRQLDPIHYANYSIEELSRVKEKDYVTIGRLIHSPDQLGRTSLDLAATLGHFDRVWELYRLFPKPSEMERLARNYGEKLLMNYHLVDFPELTQVFLPYMNGRAFEFFYGRMYTENSLTQALIDQEGLLLNYFRDGASMKRLIQAYFKGPRYSLCNPDAFNQTPAFYFAYAGLDSGYATEYFACSDLNQLNFQEESVFHIISERGDRRLLKIALEHLKDPAVLYRRRNQDDKTALDLCTDGWICRQLKKRMR